MELRGWITAAALGLAVAASNGAHAQQATDDERARLHFEAGRSHYEQGAYDRAHEEFTLAWELSRRPVLLLNLAQTNARLARYEAAAANIEEFLRLEPDTDQADVLRSRVGNLRRLAAEHEAEEASDPVGDEAVDASPSTDPAPLMPSRTDEGLLVASAVTLSVGGVGLALWGIFGGLTLTEDGALAAGCGATMGCTQAEVADLETFSLVADVSLGVGLAGAVTGAVLMVIALTSGSSEEREQVLRWNGREMAIRF